MPPQPHTQRLYKREKLCSTRAIESLFARESASGLSASLVYPFRAVWTVALPDEPRVAPVTQFLVSVPKRKLRLAVDRVRIRRLLREAWRLHREEIPQKAGLRIAFVYVGSKVESYERVAKSLRRLLAIIKGSLTDEE